MLHLIFLSGKFSIQIELVTTSFAPPKQWQQDSLWANGWFGWDVTSFHWLETCGWFRFIRVTTWDVFSEKKPANSGILTIPKTTGAE